VVTHWECPLSVWPKRIGRFKKLRLAVVRLRKSYDAESIGVAKNLNEWLTPPGEIGSLGLNLLGVFTRQYSAGTANDLIQI
jgi:hypothetical protein